MFCKLGRAPTNNNQHRTPPTEHLLGISRTPQLIESLPTATNVVGVAGRGECSALYCNGVCAVFFVNNQFLRDLPPSRLTVRGAQYCMRPLFVSVFFSGLLILWL